MGVAHEPGVATHQPSVLKASPASVPTAILISACVLLQTRKSARAGMEKIASKAKATERRGARRCVRPSLAFISVEFAPFLFPDAVRIQDTDRDLELIRKSDGAGKASFGGIGSVIRAAVRDLCARRVLDLQTSGRIDLRYLSAICIAAG